MIRRVRDLVDELRGHRPRSPLDGREHSTPQQEGARGVVLAFLGVRCEFDDADGPDVYGGCAYPGLGWRCGHLRRRRNNNQPASVLASMTNSRDPHDFAGFMPRLGAAEVTIAKMTLSLAAATDPSSTVASRAEIRRRYGLGSIPIPADDHPTIAPWDPIVATRLSAELREDDARMTRGPWRDRQEADETRKSNEVLDHEGSPVAFIASLAHVYRVPYGFKQDAVGIARLRNNARVVADQLEAARAEIDAARELIAIVERWSDAPHHEGECAVHTAVDAYRDRRSPSPHERPSSEESQAIKGKLDGGSR